MAAAAAALVQVVALALVPAQVQDHALGRLAQASVVFLAAPVNSPAVKFGLSHQSCLAHSKPRPLCPTH